VLPEIAWEFAPLTVGLGEPGELKLARGLIAARGEPMRQFLKATGNPPGGDELAVVAPVDVRWFVIISRAPRAERRAEWVEDSRESDGREVVVRTVVLPAGLRFELLSEKAGAERARLEFDAVLGGLREKGRVPSWPLPVGLALLLVFVAWLARWRRRGQRETAA
jgi:hypothetical protein